MLKEIDIKALHYITYGLYIVSSKKGDKTNGLVVNSVFQVTSDPQKIAVCICKKNLTHDFISESRVFTVSVLAQEAPLPFIGKFGFKSGRDMDKFKDVRHETGKTGVPVVIENTLCYFECELTANCDVGTHTLFVGSLVSAKMINEGLPLTYAYYHRVKAGKTPVNAPSYLPEEKKKEPQKAAAGPSKYLCTVCGYIYDPEKGDPDSGIKPGTRFEDIPDTWVCPVCGVGKDKFEIVHS